MWTVELCFKEGSSCSLLHLSVPCSLCVSGLKAPHWPGGRCVDSICVQTCSSMNRKKSYILFHSGGTQQVTPAQYSTGPVQYVMDVLIVFAAGEKISGFVLTHFNLFSAKLWWYHDQKDQNVVLRFTTMIFRSVGTSIRFFSFFPHNHFVFATGTF